MVTRAICANGKRYIVNVWANAETSLVTSKKIMGEKKKKKKKFFGEA